MTESARKKSLYKRIIKTSYELFRKKGYNNVSVNDICAACDITKPTFYNYVSSKDEIVSIFYSEITTQLLSELMAQPEIDDYWQRIVMTFDAILEHTRQLGSGLYSQLFIINLSKEVGTFDISHSLTEMMTELFKKAQDAGQIQNRSDPRELYLSVASMCYGHGIMWCLNRGRNDLLEDFHKCLETVCEVRKD